MKLVAILLATGLSLLGQEQAPVPAPDQAAAIAEIQAANQRAKAMGNPARSWLADEWTLVCFDEQMKWAMQAKLDVVGSIPIARSTKKAPKNIGFGAFCCPGFH